MKFLFQDESFSFEALRAAGFAIDGGSDIGEIIVTASRIPDGDEDAWHREWKGLADRIFALGWASQEQGHRISAREAFLRASHYYRMSEFYLRDNPFNTPEVMILSDLSRDTFQRGCALLDLPVEDVRVSFEGAKLPAYVFLVDDSGRPRPTVIYNNGFDSTREEAWFAIGAAAVRRGYNVIAFDGPGHGAALRHGKLVFRSDWETVIGAVIDYAADRAEFAPGKIVLFGYSLGALLVARAAAFDERPAALILNDGMYDFFEVNTALMPPFLVDWVRDGNDSCSESVLDHLMSVSTAARWAMRNGIWATGAASVPDYLRKTAAYTLRGIVGRIKAPTLVLEAEDDAPLKGQAAKIIGGLKARHKHIRLTRTEGAGEHCHIGAMRLLHQRAFDWLDDVLT